MDGIQPLQDKLEIIKSFEMPKNRVQLQQFIGLCTYYRQFTVRHAELLDPFRELLKAKNPWVWTSDHNHAFEVIKNAFVNSIQLKHYIPDKKYRLQTDASDLGVSGVLYQLDDNDEIKVITLVSRCLNSAEVNYTTTEKELLAIAYSVTKLRHYLIGNRFLILTDHKGLTFLNTTLYLNARLIRWSLLMQQYDFDVEYCRGQDNVVADFFSRNPQGKFESSRSNHLSIDVLLVESENCESVVCSEIKVDNEMRDSLRNLEELQKQDNYINGIIQRMQGGNKIDYFQVHEGILFHQEKQINALRIVIPEILTKRIIDCVHSKLGHPGVYKTFEYIKQFYFWKSMRKSTRKPSRKGNKEARPSFPNSLRR